MNYKTITLELIQEFPLLYEQLRCVKRLLPAMDAYAIDLREDHLETMAAMARRWPGSDSRQISAEALEIAIRNLRERLRSASPPDETDPAALDAATSGRRNPSPVE